MARPTTLVKPTDENRRSFGRWAVAHAVRSAPQNAFHVPDELLGEVPEELILGAKVNGIVYFPQPGQVALDAPPIDDDDDDDAGQRVVAGFPSVTRRAARLDESP
jgi:hypothetical protein